MLGEITESNATPLNEHGRARVQELINELDALQTWEHVRPDRWLAFARRGGSAWPLAGAYSRGRLAMPNGKLHDNPLSDFTIHGIHRFPPDIMELLSRIEAAGRRFNRSPLGENWPYSPREFDWEKGKDLDGARRDLKRLLAMLEAGRGDEVLLDPRTRKPLKPA
jgi:hypothetical protein